MKRRWMALWSAAFVLISGTAHAAAKVAASGCCPPCPFCH
jgi:hypothetical protein